MSEEVKPKVSKLEQPKCPFGDPEFWAANDEWGANCGPTALATMLNLQMEDVREHIPGFEVKRFTNMTMMKSALISLGVKWTPQGIKPYIMPKYGLALIQFEGPWMEPGVPPAAACKFTHWIGAMTDSEGFGWIYDINFDWQLQHRWEKELVLELMNGIKRCNGKWHVKCSWELFTEEIANST